MLLNDGGTADPAAWHDWCECIKLLKIAQPIDEK